MGLTGKRHLSLHPQRSNGKQKLQPGAGAMAMQTRQLRSSPAGNRPAPLCAQARAAPGSHGRSVRAATASHAGKQGAVVSGWVLPGRHTPVPASTASAGVPQAPPEVLFQLLRQRLWAGEVVPQTQGHGAAGGGCWRASPPALSASRAVVRAEPPPCREIQSRVSINERVWRASLGYP